MKSTIRVLHAVIEEQIGYHGNEVVEEQRLVSYCGWCGQSYVRVQAVHRRVWGHAPHPPGNFFLNYMFKGHF